MRDQCRGHCSVLHLFRAPTCGAGRGRHAEQHTTGDHHDIQARAHTRVCDAGGSAGRLPRSGFLAPAQISPSRVRRDYVSDTFGNATRTTVTGQCVRTTLPDAGIPFRRCDDGEVETAKAAAPAAPAAAREPEMAAAPRTGTSSGTCPAPAAPVAQEQPVTTPAASADEEVAAAQAQAEASADARYDEEVAATEEAMEPEAETAAAPAAAPEPPAEVAEAPPPAAPPAPPETSYRTALAARPANRANYAWPPIRSSTSTARSSPRRDRPSSTG